MVYREGLKNRELAKEAPQNFRLEQATIAGRQGASEDENFEVKPTQAKPDFSITSGIPFANLCLHFFVWQSAELLQFSCQLARAVVKNKLLTVSVLQIYSIFYKNLYRS